MQSTINENKSNDMKIQFGDQFAPLTYYDNEDWEIMERHLVEFYPNRWYDVILLSTETPNFLDYFSECDDDSPISLDLEWESELCLFQFCFKNKVVILRHPNGDGNQDLLNFLLSHKFYAKGINNDKKQLHKKFNTNKIADNIEDIARTRLVPYNYSENFMAMVRQFSGEPTAEFKDIKITTSNWELPKLSKRQILYAAFDVVSLKECYPNYPPPKEINKNKSNDSTKDDDDIKGSKKVKKMRKSINEMKQERSFEIKRIFSSPESTATIQTTPTILEKFKRNVKLKRSPAREIIGFILNGYNGPQNIYSIKRIFSGNENENQKSDKENDESTFLNDDFSDIDFCSTFNDCLFIGFYEIKNEEKLIEKLKKYCESFIKIEPNSKSDTLQINAEESTDGDVLFVQNISDGLIEQFDSFLFCFGVNHEFAVINDDDSSLNYIRIEPRDATQSYRIKLFLSEFEFEGKTAVVSEFPYFLPKIRINNVPNDFDEKSLLEIFKKAGEITKIEIMRRRINQDKQTAIITYRTTEEADKAVELFNHMTIGIENNSKSGYLSNMDLYLSNNLSSIEDLNNEIKVFRFSDEPHLRFMRRYEIRDMRVELFKSNSKDLEKHYSKYGRIHLCFFDPFFNVGRVQFYDKKDAIIASKSEKCEMTEESKTIVIRDLPFETTDSEILQLCSQFGSIVNLITRDINKIMRFIIKEVSFCSTEEANKAKAYFSSIKTIHGAAIRVAVLNGGFSFAPDWKMRQRKHWVKFVGQKPTDEFIQKHEKNGKIVKIEYKIVETRIVVACPVQNDDSDDDSSEKTMQPVTIPKMQEITFIMFQQFESTRTYNDTVYPTIEEFVEFLNPNELYIDKCVIRMECPNENNNQTENKFNISSNRSNSQPINLKHSIEERKPVQMAIVIDPIPNFVNKELLVDYLGEFSENCDVFISLSMCQNSDFDDDNDDEESENDDDDDSDKMKRAVLVPTSRTLTNKIYSMMNDRPISDSINCELLKPVRMRFENVPNSPTIRKREKIFVKQESKKMTIVVDPLPPRMKMSDIENLCGNFGKYSLTITGSALIEGRKRALIHPMSCRAKKHIFRAMSVVFDDEEIVPVRIFPRDIPPPIESSQENPNSNSDSTSTSISA